MRSREWFQFLWCSLGLYFGAVIALHKGTKPLSDMVSLFRDLLPERMGKATFPAAVDQEGTLIISSLGREAKSETDFSSDIISKP